MSDHDNKCEFMLAPPDMNRLGLCLCKERALKARLAELEAERTGTIHESWQHKTHAELLEGLKWQGAITKSLLASNDELQAWLAEAKGLLEEIGDEWPAVKRTTVERAYAFIERATDSAEVAPKPGVCRHCGQYLDRRGKCRNPEHNS